jgi:LAS superfamily LD-carboxypeptidase LdcB
MGARVTRDLFLQIGGSADGLSAASKAGRTALLNLGKTGENVADEVQKAFADLGKTNIEASVKDIERTYNRTFDTIRANAKAVLDAPSPKSAIQVIDVAAAKQAASVAEAQAASLRLVADAAARAAQATQGDAAAARVYAVAAEAAAVGAHDHAAALRDQVVVLEAVQAEHIKSTGAVVESGRKYVVSAGQQRQGVLQLGEQFRQFSTEVSLGINPIVAFTQQSGQAAFALTNFGGKLGKVGNFMAGPWGTLALVAVGILGQFAYEAIKANNAIDDAVKKLGEDAKQSDISRVAHEIFAKSLEGQREATIKLNEELGKGIKTQQDDAAQAYKDAKAHLEVELALRRRLEAQLKLNQASLEAQVAQSTNPANFNASDPTLGQTGSLGPADAQYQLDKTKKEIEENSTSIAAAQKRVSLTIGDIADRAAKAASDPLKGLNDRYDEMVAKARRASVANQALAASIAKLKPADRAAALDAEKLRLTGEITDIENRRAAALKAQRESDSGRNPNRQFGREVDVAQATAIVRGIGGRVTSGYRSHEKQQQLYADKLSGRHDGPVAVPGTSAHESGGAIDVAFGPGISIASIKKAFADAGVQLRQVLREEGQKVFHVEFGKKGPSQDVLDKRAQAEREKAANDDRAYQSQLGQAQDRIKGDMAALAETIEQRAIIEGFGIENARVQRDLEIKDQFAAGKIDDKRRDILLKLNDSAARLETDAVKKKLREAQDDLTLQIGRDEIRDKIALLQLQGNLATTGEERKRVALEILDLEEREARATLANAISKETDPAKRASLEAQLGNVGPAYAAQRQSAERQNADPLEAYRNQLQESVGSASALKETLGSIEVHGLSQATDDLSGAVVQALRLKGIAGQIVGEFAKIALQKLILKVIGGGLFAEGRVPGFSTGLIPGFATGMVDSDGVIHGPGTGTSDSIFALLGGSPIRIANEESIMTARATKRYGPVLKAMNDNTLPGFATGRIPDSAIYYPRLPDAAKLQRQSATPQIVYVKVDKSDLFDVHVQRVAAPLAQAAMVGGSALAQQELSDQRLQVIP